MKPTATRSNVNDPPAPGDTLGGVVAMLANHAQAIAANTAGVGPRNAIAIDCGDAVAALVVNGRGTILDCDPSGEALFGYRRNELVGQHVSMLLPQLAEVDLLQNGQINPYLRFLCRIGRNFTAVTEGGEHFVSELFLNLPGSIDPPRLSLIVRPAETFAGAAG